MVERKEQFRNTFSIIIGKAYKLKHSKENTLGESDEKNVIKILYTRKFYFQKNKFNKDYLWN